MLFKCCRLLPDEVGKQSPRLLFGLLDALGEDDGENDDYSDNEYLMMFYGR